MNESAWEREILLAESGELTARRAERLERHLAECAACRDYRARMRAIAAEAEHAFAGREPAAETLARVRKAVAVRPASRVLAFPPGAVRALAYAATLALLLGGWFLATSLRREGRIGTLNAAVIMVAEADAMNDAEVDEGAPAEPLRALAQDLLRLEGLADDTETFDPFTSFGEPTPTAFQRHSSPEHA
jgi:anti-sigma factor RsiW